MAMREFEIELVTNVRISVDDSLVPDDEWRESFYASIRTLEDVAAHFAYNYVHNSTERLSRLDGWADRDDALMRIIGNQTAVESVEAISR